MLYIDTDVSSLGIVRSTDRLVATRTNYSIAWVVNWKNMMIIAANQLVERRSSGDGGERGDTVARQRYYTGLLKSRAGRCERDLIEANTHCGVSSWFNRSSFTDVLIATSFSLDNHTTNYNELI